MRARKVAAREYVGILVDIARKSTNDILIRGEKADDLELTAEEWRAVCYELMSQRNKDAAEGI